MSIRTFALRCVAALALAAVVGSAAACDAECWSQPVHMDRCQKGDTESCDWLLAHVDPTTGVCG